MRSRNFEGLRHDRASFAVTVHLDWTERGNDATFWTPENGDCWIIEDDDGSRWMISRDGGEKQPFQWDPTLVQPIDVPSSAPASLQIILVGVPEIAVHAGVRADTVRKWRQRHADFPRPLAELNAGPVWSLGAVERWLRTHATSRDDVDLLSVRELRPGRRPKPAAPGPQWHPQTSRLFNPEADDYRLIAMPGSGEDGWPAYIEGCRMAAAHVLDRIASTKHDQDFLAYPLVFLYRQFLELQLKLVIHLGRELHGGRGASMNTHALTALRDVAIGHIRRVWPDDHQDTTAIRADLEEFDSLDRRSFAFRYPEGTTQERSLPPNLARFNVAAFAHRAEEIGAYLDGATEGMWVQRDWKLEMEEELAR